MVYEYGKQTKRIKMYYNLTTARDIFVTEGIKIKQLKTNSIVKRPNCQRNVNKQANVARIHPT